MTIYYTAKDIEEMAAKGIRQIEVGPGITLTDFARETAQQLNVALVDSSRATPTARPTAPAAQPAAAARPAAAATPARSSGRFNKPSGCMHGANPLPATRSQAAVSSNQPGSGANASIGGANVSIGGANASTGGASSNSVNRLIDLMGKVIKRGE